VRYFYSFLFYLALPFVLLRLLWRSRRLPAYRERFPERFGFYPKKFDQCIWVHAVSVGEAIAAIPMIKALISRYPSLPIVVTTMTPTGAVRIKSGLGDTVTHAYIPYDLPDAMARFLTAMNPVVGIIMETELWPNMLTICHQKAIPVCLVNARLSEKSARGYQRIASLTREMLQTITVIAANGQPDADRFIALGAIKEHVTVTGNMKFDLELPANLAEARLVLREQLGRDRFIWIAASTHEGEEEIILAAHKKIRELNPQALLILVPRHPDRFDAMATLCAREFNVIRRSQKRACSSDIAVFLGDSMGELPLMYSVVDVAFVGGSLIPRGGHNLLEPAALGKAILMGPHFFNFLEISNMFLAAKALIKITDVKTLTEQLVILMQNVNERSEMGQRALQMVNANRGVLDKQLALISSVMR
jgi:3-deoxy-D-manno-octulosonic-acid transferase